MSATEIAHRLREQVERVKGWPTAVAKTPGVARNTVYNWMDKGNVPADKLDECRLLGIDADYVFTGVRRYVPNIAEPAAEYSVVSHEQAIALYWRATHVVATALARQGLDLPEWQVAGMIDFVYQQQLDERAVSNLASLFCCGR